MEKKGKSKVGYSSNKVELKWRVPYYIIIAIFVFLLINSITILNVRGIVDKEGYLWNSSYSIPVNRYEDDGGINVYDALGYFKIFSEKFACLINIGGPYIHVARFLLWVGSKTGIVKIFEDPFTYYIYPQEYLKIWKFFGLYKVLLFLWWLPLVVYWIGTRNFSKTTGVIAALLVVSISFITGFEPRLKADSVSIILGLFSMLWQLEYIRSRKSFHLLLSAVFLGISFSVKLIMLPALFTLFIVYWVGVKKEGESLFKYRVWRKFLCIIGIVFLVFIISNPLIIFGFKMWLGSIGPYVQQGLKSQGASKVRIVIFAVWYRILHFDSHLGMALNLLVIPSLVFAGICMFWNKSHRRISTGILFIFLILYFAYYAIANQERIIFITYYYYGAAIVAILLIAEFLAVIIKKIRPLGRIALSGFVALISFLIISTICGNIKVFSYMISKTNRQEMYSWINENIPKGAVVGIPLDPSHAFFSQWIKLDPFKYRIVNIGRNTDLIDKNQPEYLIWVLYLKGSKGINNKDYVLYAQFNNGVNLPHERYDLYQEEVFQVYKRVSPPVDVSERSILGGMEYEVGDFLCSDPEKEFRILQYQSISFMPLWLNLVRKRNDSIDYDSHMSFEKSIKGVGSHDFKYSHVDNIGATTLQLWGVKYILAKLSPGSSFEEQVLNSGRYNLKEIRKYKTIFGDEKRDVGLYYNNEYVGQVFFVRYGSEVDNRGRETRGILYDLEKVKKLNTNNLAVFFKIKTKVPLNISIKGGGNSESWDVSIGEQVVWMPYRIFNKNEPITYEINPIESNGRVEVKSISVVPLYLYGGPVINNVKITRKGGSAVVNADSSGEVIFSLPFHEYWRVKVDGKLVPFKKGLAGTVAVSVSAGKYFLEVEFV